MPHIETVTETARLVLRRWQVSDAAMQRRLWEERDPRVPQHRRISTDGHPTVEDLEAKIRAGEYERLLVVERADDGEAIGYCGLIPNAHGEGDEPELAYELLRDHWGQRYATEAAGAVVEWATTLGCRRLWATVRDWNVASQHVLTKFGFVKTARVTKDAEHGDSEFWTKTLRP